LRLESQRKLLETSVEQLRADELLEQGWSINQEYLKEALEKVEKGSTKGSWQFRRYWSAENKMLIAKETDPAFKGLLKQYLF